jgi:hypothetical protein
VSRDWWFGLWAGALLLLTFEMIFWILLVSTPPERGVWKEWRHYLIDHLDRPDQGDLGASSEKKE